MPKRVLRTRTDIPPRWTPPAHNMNFSAKTKGSDTLYFFPALTLAGLVLAFEAPSNASRSASNASCLASAYMQHGTNHEPSRSTTGLKSMKGVDRWQNADGSLNPARPPPPPASLRPRKSSCSCHAMKMYSPPGSKYGNLLASMKFN